MDILVDLESNQEIKVIEGSGSYEVMATAVATK
jgi:hypothetical protein